LLSHVRSDSLMSGLVARSCREATECIKVFHFLIFNFYNLNIMLSALYFCAFLTSLSFGFVLPSLEKELLCCGDNCPTDTWCDKYEADTPSDCAPCCWEGDDGRIECNPNSCCPEKGQTKKKHESSKIIHRPIICCDELCPADSWCPDQMARKDVYASSDDDCHESDCYTDKEGRTYCECFQ